MTFRSAWWLVGAIGLCSGVAGAEEAIGYKPPLTISVVNASTSVSNAEVAVWAAAIQRQVHEHLAPVWKVDSDVRLRDTPGDGDWVCRVEDEAPANPALMGTHFVREDGSPGCTVYARSILSIGAHAVSYTLSHEILEMLVDPWLSNVTFAPNSMPNVLPVYLREICDPVSAYSYEIDAVQVADFTLPEFWRAPGVGGGRTLDYRGAALAALSPAGHSYMLVRYITPFGDLTFRDGWQYIWGSYCIFGPC
jgi:hypothetical protein